MLVTAQAGLLFQGEQTYVGWRSRCSSLADSGMGPF